MRYERSTNGGRTWQEVEVHPRSVLTLERMTREHPLDDGCGNLYRPLDTHHDNPTTR